MQAQASGAVLPPGTLPKVSLPAGDLVVTILKVYPENGHKEDGTAHAADHDMVDVALPDGAQHEFQIKPGDKTGLAEKVKNLLQGKYTVAGFSFAKIPEVVVGGEFHLVSVTHA